VLLSFVVVGLDNEKVKTRLDDAIEEDEIVDGQDMPP
jgi:hypothetical protein